MNDPLAQYRKKPLNSSEQTPPPKGGDDYVAFDAKDRVERLRIRRANAPTRTPGYNYLLDVVYDGSYGTNFVLIYTFLMVCVRGRNLQPIISLLELSTTDFIQEFDAERWEKPKDDTMPFIESIEVVVQENGPSIADTENSKTVH